MVELICEKESHPTFFNVPTSKDAYLCNAIYDLYINEMWVVFPAAFLYVLPETLFQR